jgi:hypothetical protein
MMTLNHARVLVAYATVAMAVAFVVLTIWGAWS